MVGVASPLDLSVYDVSEKMYKELNKFCFNRFKTPQHTNFHQSSSTQHEKKVFLGNLKLRSRLMNTPTLMLYNEIIFQLSVYSWT